MKLWNQRDLLLFYLFTFSRYDCIIQLCAKCVLLKQIRIYLVIIIIIIIETGEQNSPLPVMPLSRPLFFNSDSRSGEVTQHKLTVPWRASRCWLETINALQEKKRAKWGTLFQFVINWRVRGRCFFFAFTEFAESERVSLSAAGVQFRHFCSLNVQFSLF